MAVSFFCTTFAPDLKTLILMRRNLIQLITAAILALGGLVMLFCGVYVEPQGQIHESLLIGFGEVATFAGALFGIDAAYSQKLWDFINSSDNPHKAKPSGAHYRPSTKTPSQKNKSSSPHILPLKTQNEPSPPDNTES